MFFVIVFYFNVANSTNWESVCRAVVVSSSYVVKLDPTVRPSTIKTSVNVKE